MKLNLGSGRFPLDGFVNLDCDEANNWHAREGLPFADRSIEAITISHMLMYLNQREIARLLADCHRVLVPGGIVRVTEDDTWSLDSGRKGIQAGAVTATAPHLIEEELRYAWFDPVVLHLDPLETLFKDASLIQRFHGDPPDVFHLEGLKP